MSRKTELMRHVVVLLTLVDEKSKSKLRSQAPATFAGVSSFLAKIQPTKLPFPNFGGKAKKTLWLRSLTISTSRSLRCLNTQKKLIQIGTSSAKRQHRPLANAGLLAATCKRMCPFEVEHEMHGCMVCWSAGADRLIGGAHRDAPCGDRRRWQFQAIASNHRSHDHSVSVT